MSYSPPLSPRLQSPEGSGSRILNLDSQRLKSLGYATLIHILDNDSLLNVFHFCRPTLLDEDEDDEDQILLGGEWLRERWWYELVHVCRRWRYLILGSASYLCLYLLCTYDTQIADMLENSPPLPLILDYVDADHDITVEDEEAIILALKHRDRVRRIRLLLPNSTLRKLLVAVDEDFLALKYLYLGPLTSDNEGLILPKSFRAPDLRHLILMNFALPLGSPLLLTAMNLFTLSLQDIPPSIYIRPDQLLQRLSFMPELDTLGIAFYNLVPSRNVERRLFHTPITTHVTLPNLRWFGFGGVSAYVEALLPWMSTPSLEKLQTDFFNQLTFAVPHLTHLMNTNVNLRFSSSKLGFYDEGLVVKTYPRKGAKKYAWSWSISCRHLDWQVSGATQIFNALHSVFPTATVDLILEYKRVSISPERHGVERTQWRELLRLFGNVKTLHVSTTLVGELARSLLAEDGESPTDLFPNLEEISYSGTGDAEDALAAFINIRQNAGRPVTLVGKDMPLPWKWS
ncbi:hypothetical protein BC827DRAFT_831092 [Russula dissimulans]|nr:hypothetical protein BC827DRAFT_831092 [Russula dissimulans]